MGLVSSYCVPLHGEFSIDQALLVDGVGQGIILCKGAGYHWTPNRHALKGLLDQISLRVRLKVQQSKGISADS
jgi:hypothetical protein